MSSSFFKWDDDFNTGNIKVDSQHFALVDMVNKLLEFSINNKTIEIEAIEATHMQLTQYVSEHFSTEKALMEAYAIDPRHAEDHNQAHNDFVRVVTGLFADPIKLQSPENLNEVVEYLIRWLAYHILNTDKSLVRQISYISNEDLSPSQAFEKEEQVTEQSTEPLLKALKVLYLLVSKKNREIERKNIDLENKVRQRMAELSEANEKLSQMLLHDVLTGLPNRRFVMEEIQRLFNDWERYKVPFSLLFVDVDKFKSVNDTYGHENGDKVLMWIAQHLTSNTRKTDFVCRLGGDEFVIICSHTDAKGALAIGEKLNRFSSDKSGPALEFWKPSISIGISTISERTKSPSEILRKADDAMYISKSRGGGMATAAES